MKKIEQTTIVADSYYTIANAAGKVIEAAEGGNGAAIQLATASKSANQEWAFLRMGEGVYHIQNHGTGKMMDLVWGGTMDGTELHQWEEANVSTQLWIIEACNDGTVKIKAQPAPGKCVDVVGISNEDGAHLQIWADMNGDNQKWTITEVKGTKKAKAEPVAEVKTEEKKVEETKAEVAPVAEVKKEEEKPAAPAEEVKAEAEAPKAAAAKPATKPAKKTSKKKSTKKNKKK